MKHSSYKNPTTSRSALPLVENTKNGKMLMCPFCKPSHPVYPFQPSSCGTVIEVSAVQKVYRAKFDKRIRCAKCGQGGGEMVHWQNAYIHTVDCAPEVKTLAAPPKYSRFARWVFLLRSAWFKEEIQKVTGKAVPVDEVTPDGTKTGKTLGYFFYKG